LKHLAFAECLYVSALDGYGKKPSSNGCCYMGYKPPQHIAINIAINATSRSSSSGSSTSTTPTDVASIVKIKTRASSFGTTIPCTVEVFQQTSTAITILSETFRKIFRISIDVLSSSTEYLPYIQRCLYIPYSTALSSRTISSLSDVQNSAKFRHHYRDEQLASWLL